MSIPVILPLVLGFLLFSNHWVDAASSWRSPSSFSSSSVQDPHAEAFQSNEVKLGIWPMGEIKKAVGESFVLNCVGENADTRLFSDLKWYDPAGYEMVSKEHISVMSTNNNEKKQLAFMRPTRKDAGVYTCRGLFQDNTELQASVKVVIYEGIVWKNCPEVQALVKGRSNEKIKCTAVSDPAADVTWLKENSPIDSLRYRTYYDGIEIGAESLEQDAGLYVVQATVMETGQLEQKLITVEVHVQPRIVEIADEVEAIEGESMTLTCTATATPRSDYSWTNPRGRNTSETYGYETNTTSGEVKILKVKDTDSGKFTCRASNAAGYDERQILVNVITKPVVTSLANVTAPEGSTAVIECRASGNPPPNLSMRKDGPESVEIFDGQARISVQTSIDSGEATLVLTINDVTRSDDGLYYCAAENKAAKVEQAGHLEVQFKPDLASKTPTLVKTWKDHQVNISCIAESIPNATIRWFDSRGESLDSSYRFTTHRFPGRSELTVDPRVPGDVYDEYECRAENALGEASIKIKLEEAFPPGQLSAARIVKKSPVSVTFEFEDPEKDGGLPIKKYHATFFESQNPQETQRSKSWLTAQSGVYTIDGLRSETKYTFRFFAANDAGSGPAGVEIETDLPNESQPERVVILYNGPDCCSGSVQSRFNQEYTLQWKEPANNGRPIESYDIKYYKVEKSEESDEWIEAGSPMYETIASNEVLTYRFQNLDSNSYYRVEITARNALGNSVPSFLVFKTANYADGSDSQFGSSFAMASDLNKKYIIPSLLGTYFLVHFLLYITIRRC